MSEQRRSPRRGLSRPLIPVLIAALLLVTAPPGARPAAALPASAPIAVTIGAEVGPINPRVYGANYGPWSVVSPDMLQPAWDSGVTFIRWPGGNWGDQNTMDSFHLSLLFALTDKGHMEPSISVRLKGSTPEQAAALVRTLNIEQKRGIVYWSIGNEPDLYDNAEVKALSQQWRAFALAMRAVDPSIKLMGPEVSQFPWAEKTDPYLQARYDWVREFLKINGDLVDIVTVHRYPFPVSNNAPAVTIADLRGNLAQWDTFIPTLRALIRATLGRDLPVGLTEVNSNWTNGGGGEATPDSYYNAIWWGGVLGKLVNQRVDIVTFFVLYTPGTVGELGMITREKPRATYYTYQLYKRLGPTLLQSSADSPDVVTVATRNAAGQIALLVVNAADADQSITLTPALAAPIGIWRLDPTHNAESIAPAVAGPGADSAYTLPGRSITVYLFGSQNEGN